MNVTQRNKGTTRGGRWLHLGMLLLTTVGPGLAAAAAESEALVFPPAYSNHLVRALDALNMGVSDLGFKKDVAETRLVLPDVRRCLTEPLHATRMADAALAASAQGLRGDWWRLAGAWLDATGAVERVEGATRFAAPAGLDPELSAALGNLLCAADVCRMHLVAAFKGLAAEERQWAAAYALSGVLDFEDRAADREAAATAGIPQGVVERVVSAARDLDPAPHSRRFADALARVNRAELLEAARGMVEASGQLSARAAQCRVWPGAVVRTETPMGEVVVGTLGDDEHQATVLLVLDPGGNDRYGGTAGAANGLCGLPVSVAIDLGGNDTHNASGIGGAGSAVFGVGVLIDRSGNDCFTGEAVCCGAAVMGVGWAEDQGGDDRWRCERFGQAAACGGVGVLRDDGGRDLYDAGVYAQGYAGPLAMAWLVDAGGNDTYTAGGVEPDYERHKERHLSLAQGFGFGMRPSCGGGIGVLVDLEGNDTYTADVYGQGVSYWYSLGMLLDVTGQDAYSVYEYGQGVGIHLSSGLLFDGEGDDVYTGYSLAQGSAHDFAAGILIDGAGNDTYTADHFSQGRAINNSAAILCDGAGSDAYFGRRDGECQGMGHHNTDRGYGSLSVLMDLGGRDRYSEGAVDGARMLRPNFGIIYDVKE